MTASLISVEQKLDGKIDATFRWVIGIILVNWITLMLAILHG
jgi:hypothetical protein